MLPKKHYWAIRLFVGIAERERAADGTAGTWKGLLAWIGSEATCTGECKHHAEGASTQFRSQFHSSKPQDSQEAPDSKALGAELT